MLIDDVEGVNHRHANVSCLSVVLMAIKKVHGVHLVIDETTHGVTLCNPAMIFPGSAFLFFIPCGRDTQTAKPSISGV